MDLCGFWKRHNKYLKLNFLWKNYFLWEKNTVGMVDMVILIQYMYWRGGVNFWVKALLCARVCCIHSGLSKGLNYSAILHLRSPPQFSEVSCFISSPCSNNNSYLYCQISKFVCECFQTNNQPWKGHAACCTLYMLAAWGYFNKISLSLTSFLSVP